ncbi:hypothetical protein K501DRAFT_267416 [Backusella circina FSU 941]|nr:hypothetical protein K501DRAFT_267416 [Backusella circina FSU 941]
MPNKKNKHHVTFDKQTDGTDYQAISKEEENEWMTAAIRKYELKEWNNDMNEYTWFFGSPNEHDNEYIVSSFNLQAISVKEKKQQEEIDSLKEMINYLKSQLDIERTISYSQIESIERNLNKYYNEKQTRVPVVRAHSSPGNTSMSFGAFVDGDNLENDLIYESD